MLDAKISDNAPAEGLPGQCAQKWFGTAPDPSLVMVQRPNQAQ